MSDMMVIKPLDVAGEFLGNVTDRLRYINYVSVQAMVFSDQDGVLYYEESDDGKEVVDGGIWVDVLPFTLHAGIILKTPWINHSKRYFRFKVINGAIAQTEFKFYEQKNSLVDPNTNRNSVVVVPSDTANIVATNSLYIGVAGDLKVTLANMVDDTFVIYKGLSQGSHPISAKRIWTGTLATDILAVY
jgi:hypothetical protein